MKPDMIKIHIKIKKCIFRVKAYCIQREVLYDSELYKSTFYLILTCWTV